MTDSSALPNIQEHTHEYVYLPTKACGAIAKPSDSFMTSAHLLKHSMGRSGQINSGGMAASLLLGIQEKVGTDLLGQHC